MVDRLPRCGEGSVRCLAQGRDTDRRTLQVAKGLDDNLCQMRDVQVMQEGWLTGAKRETAEHTLVYCKHLAAICSTIRP